MSYEEKYNELKYSLFTAVKRELSRYLKLSRTSNDLMERELSRQRYKALYDQIIRCALEDEYEAWDWQEEE